ncbi:MAG: PBP1A family penicillin-binding protein [Deltaproteobacteria bacterium]|nr:PBP1A family penicillin-binding protein [Deltaproteobacteria bacterium]
MALFFFGACLFGATAGAFFAITRDLPQIRALQEYKPPGVTRMYSTEGILLTELFHEKRNPVPLHRIPETLKSAIFATEDRQFYDHIGVDLKGILRAVVRNIVAGEFVEGASTLTQQLAKTLFLTSKKSLSRKIKEAVLAVQIERRFSKDEILELYLNQVYLGSGAYGVEAAARIYFGKPVESLNLAECALIAGLPKAPSRFSPRVHPEAARKRRNVVLKQMRELGIITETDFRHALQAPVVCKNTVHEIRRAPYFVEYVQKHLERQLGADLLYKGGLIIKTSLSMPLQAAAESAVENGLSALEDRMVRARIENPDPQGALVAIDVSSGAILAMVGGKDFTESPYNRVTSAKRQPGSAFKPFVYACAVENGFLQNQMLLDTPLVFRGGHDGGEWRPKNFSRGFQGEMTMRKALAVSENIPTIRLIERVGPACVARFARAAGIQSPLAPNLSLALGTSEVTLLELTAAYGVFANKGEWVQPECLAEVQSADGRILWAPNPQKRGVMRPMGAAIITDMLRAVIEEGTGKRARALGRPVAGKTGTTDDCRDALFIGYTPFLLTGVWVGQDLPRSLGKGETGAKAALPIWIDFMEAALADSGYAHFDVPDDGVFLFLDPDTGRLSEAPFEGAVKALFPKTVEILPE